MRIVVLDGYTLNPGDLSWEPLKRLGEVVLFDRTRHQDVVARLVETDAVLTNKVVIDGGAFDQLPKLRYVGVTATGFNIVDLPAARSHEVRVTNVPNYGTSSVAQATFALLLELTNRTGHHAQTVQDGRWAKSADFCYWDYPLIELQGRTLGIIGFGRIGQEVAKIARAFGMRILVYLNRSKPLEEDIRAVSLENLLGESDVVSLHCPLTPETKGIINSRNLKLMKPTALLLNTSRGPLVVEADLAAALQNEQIAGAGLDVLSVEPPDPDNPLFKAPNCFITPHIAWATRAARQRLLDITVSNLEAFLAGRPQNVVS